MSWSFRRRIKVAPGVKLNVSKSGISTTVGGKGASVSIGENGVSRNLGIPGTGIYRRDKLSSKKRKEAAEPEKLDGVGMLIAAFLVSGLVGLLFSWGANATVGIISAIVLFFAIILLSSSRESNEEAQEIVPAKPQKPKEIVNPSAPKKWSKKQKLSSVEKLEKKRIKKRYLSENPDILREKEFEATLDSILDGVEPTIES